ncbi:MAG: hypothetical protein OXC60_12695 [Litoreibacter sp.]|nr:hypothetical protein [Litoreibacter sp.]
MRSILAGRHPATLLAPKREGGRGDARRRERRTISLMTYLTPTAAWSQSCTDVRPSWVPGTQVTAWSEAIQLFSMPPSLVLLVASAIVIRTRSQWGALAVVVFWTGLVALVTFASERLYGSLAITEGCIGSPALFIAAVTAICTAMILYTLPRETRL